LSYRSQSSELLNKLDLLAANNNIGKNAYFEEEIANKLADILLKQYPELIKVRYKLENLTMDGIALLESIAKKKGFPHKNHGIDMERAAITLLNDYRQGLLGRMSLETPESRIFMMSRQAESIEKEPPGNLEIE